MERDLQGKLIAWKSKPGRLPLILQGARQVGKTYLMKWLGVHHFRQYAYFNFEERPELKEFFIQNKDVDRILNALSLISGFTLDSETLVILDEIQECPEALNALKYFTEKKSEIPVICAGSLLGLLLHQGHSFPVGKVSFMTVYPMTFREVLPYWDEKSARFLEQINAVEPLPSFFYNDLVFSFKKYLITGGMPAVVQSLQMNQTFESCDEVLNNLILSYKGDFAKHPVMTDVAKIGLVFDSLPAQLSKENKKFLYQLIRTGARAREYEDAILWLIRAGLLYQVKLSQKPGIPLSAYDDSTSFKLYCMDVGIMRKLSNLAPKVFSEGTRLFTEFKGALSENYILQSLVSQFDVTPRYWNSGNEAEVDFLLQFENRIIPVEVKSEENIKSRSLSVYNNKFKPELMIRYSLRNLHQSDNMLNIPHFMADYTKHLIELLPSW